MVFKITIENEIIKTLYKIKNELYGEDSNRIRNSFLLSKLVLKKNYTKDEIETALNEWSKESCETRVKMATTMNFNQKAYDILKKMSNDMSLSMADIVRAIILINVNNKEVENEKVRNPLKEFASKVSLQFHEKDGAVLQEKNLVLKVFRWWNARFTNEELEECEKSEEAKELYRYLSWKYEYFDIINSFWQVFLSKAVIIEANKEKPLFRFNNKIEMDTSAANKPADYISEIKKEFFVKPYISYINKNSNHCGNRTKDKKMLMNTIMNDDKISKFVETVYTLPNFMPVPDGKFNAIKGCVANDSLPVMLEIIERKINANEKLVVNKDIVISVYELKNWKKWFIENREKVFLEDYYIIVENNIIPKKDFKKQSLDHPMPTNSIEFDEFLSNIEVKYTARKARFLEYVYNKHHQ